MTGPVIIDAGLGVIVLVLTVLVCWLHYRVDWLTSNYRADLMRRLQHLDDGK